MITTEINPAWLDARVYASFLARGFRASWDSASYDWYVARAFNGRQSDVLVRAEGTRILAGVSLCYRQVVIGDRDPIDICVAAAGTTSPEERRHGHYRELLQSVVARARERSCAAILGFVTRTNGSGRGLQRIGARSIPSFYIMSRGRSPLRPPPPQRRPRERAVVERIDTARAETLRRMFERFEARGPAHARFHYPNAEDWRNQFLRRPNAVGMVRIAHDSAALVERVGATDRLQWLACPGRRAASNVAILVQRSLDEGRQFFMYTADPLQASTARRLGLGVLGGYLMLQPTGAASGDWVALAGATWRVQSGDRL